jgi:hypothetical protein
MNAQLSTHLSQEALDDVLIGLGSTESELHLETCAACREKLEEFHANVRTFNQASLAWSEARPMARLDVAAKAKASRRMLSPLEWALAAAVLLLIGMTAWNREHRPMPDRGVAVAPAPPEDSETQIAQDNDLLRSIDASLSANDVSPLSDYQISENQVSAALHKHPKARSGSRNR